jgi:hypothetical protein
MGALGLLESIRCLARLGVHNFGELGAKTRNVVLLLLVELGPPFSSRHLLFFIV